MTRPTRSLRRRQGKSDGLAPESPVPSTTENDLAPGNPAAHAPESLQTEASVTPSTSDMMAVSLSVLLNAVPDAVVVADQLGKISFINQQTTQMFGYLQEEMIGQPLEKLMPEQYRETHQHHQQAFMRAPITRPMGIGLDLWGIRKDGTEFPVEISLAPLQLDGVDYVFASIRDVTERKDLELATQRALEEAEARRVLLQTVIDQMPGGVYLVHGADARLVLANRAAFEVWGASWAREQPMLEFLQSSGVRIMRVDGTVLPPAELATLRAAGANETVLQQQEVIRHPDGTSLPILVNAVSLSSAVIWPHRQPHVSDSEQLALVVLQDVTSLKESERLKDEFIAIAAHELRNPIAVLRGFTDMLIVQTARGRGTPLVDWQNEAIESIDLASHRLVELTDDLLDVTRLQAGRLEINPKIVDLMDVIQPVVDRMGTLSRAHVLTLDGPSDPVLVSIDVIRIEQVINNLLMNAMKYSPDGGPVEVRVVVNPPDVVVSIHDHGIGIPAQQQMHMFNRFARADNAKEHGIAGTGLGLYLCRELIERHDGRIWFESIEGEGSTFSFALPLH